MRELKLTSDEKRLIAEFVAEYNGGEVEDYLDEELDYSDYGVLDCDLTRDTFDGFDGRHWREYNGKTETEVGGCRAVHYDRIQPFKGSRRYTLWVVDLGDFRACVQR